MTKIVYFNKDREQVTESDDWVTQMENEQFQDAKIEHLKFCFREISEVVNNQGREIIHMRMCYAALLDKLIEAGVFIEAHGEDLKQEMSH